MVFDHNSRTPLPAGPYPTDFHAASKIAALEATMRSFEILNPASISRKLSLPFIRKNELVTDVKEIMLGTNALAFGVVLGNKLPCPFFHAVVHAHDSKHSSHIFSTLYHLQHSNFRNSCF